MRTYPGEFLTLICVWTLRWLTAQRLDGSIQSQETLPEPELPPPWALVWSVRSVTPRFSVQSFDIIFDHDLNVSGSWTKTLYTLVSMLLVSCSHSNTHMSFDYKYHLHIFHLSFIVFMLYPEMSFFLSSYILCVRHFYSHNSSVTVDSDITLRWWNSLSFLWFENVICADNMFWMNISLKFFPFNPPPRYFLLWTACTDLDITYSTYTAWMHMGMGPSSRG